MKTFATWSMLMAACVFGVGCAPAEQAEPVMTEEAEVVEETTEAPAETTTPETTTEAPAESTEAAPE